MGYGTRKPKATEAQVKVVSSEGSQTAKVSVGKETIRVKQATVPTGIFPLPARVLRWAGLTQRQSSHDIS